MKSGLTPRFLNCQCPTNPAEINARAIITPNEFIVKPPIWKSSGYMLLLQLLCYVIRPRLARRAPPGTWRCGRLSHAGRVPVEADPRPRPVKKAHAGRRPSGSSRFIFGTARVPLSSSAEACTGRTAVRFASTGVGAGRSGRTQAYHPAEPRETLLHLMAAAVRTDLGRVLEETAHEHFELAATGAAL